MDAANGPAASRLHFVSPDNVEINVDRLAAAVAGLNSKILRLRNDIVAFKEENKMRLIQASAGSSRPPSSGLDDSARNKMEARYEHRGDSKGGDSPSRADLSGRSSFAKRARQVKAAAVFKEDYPRADKSIGDDERPNKSRVPQSSRTYRRGSVPDSLGKQGDEMDVRIARTFGDDKPRRPRRHRRNEGVSANPGNVASRVKKKRISRGVQYDVPAGHRSQTIGCRFLLNCFASDGKTDDSVIRETKKQETLRDGTTFGNAVNENAANCGPPLVEQLTSSGTRSDKGHDVSDERAERLPDNAEASKNDEQAARRITADTNDRDESRTKKNGDLENPKSKGKKGFFRKFIAMFFTRDHHAQVQRDASRCVTSANDDSSTYKKQTNGEHGHADADPSNGGRGIDASVRKTDSSNARSSANATSADESGVDNARRRLDYYIAELSEIIGDASVIFGEGGGRPARSDE